MHMFNEADFFARQLYRCPLKGSTVFGKLVPTKKAGLYCKYFNTNHLTELFLLL